jgi:2-dehydro-3-deoxy-D-arabinonate dehydratase
MNLCRFKDKQNNIRIGLATNNSTLVDLTAAGITQMQSLLESDDPVAQLNQINRDKLPQLDLSSVELCAPVEHQEVWAAGVTYLRSKAARMEESDFSASAYDRVYAAERPELFFKSIAEKIVSPGEAVGIRRDARWNVPEPELALVINSRSKIVGHTIGNDMSSRDIEGENLLYLPQAKIYDRSCALGPWIHLGASESAAREWKIQIEIRRGQQSVFAGETSAGKLKRGFGELTEFLFRSQRFPQGVILLTGTGVVPPDDFTLREKDVIEIKIDGIGSLQNPVIVV